LFGADCESVPRGVAQRARDAAIGDERSEPMSEQDAYLGLVEAVDGGGVKHDEGALDAVGDRVEARVLRHEQLDVVGPVERGLASAKSRWRTGNCEGPTRTAFA
jgi:hypothetical protein